MTRPDPWRLDAGLYLQARERWIKRDRPSAASVRAVDDWVLDVMLDPTSRGETDPEVPDLYNGSAGRGILVIYGLNPETRMVAVFEIGSSPGPSSPATG